MNIYTSYFAKAKKLPANLIQIAICQYKPEWFTGPCIRMLAPSPTILHNYKCTKDEAYYIGQFTAYLRSLEFVKVMEAIEDVSEGRDAVLLCYERPEDFCHRHLVADWLTEHGQPCEEFQFSR